MPRWVYTKRVPRSRARARLTKGGPLVPVRRRRLALFVRPPTRPASGVKFLGSFRFTWFLRRRLRVVQVPPTRPAAGVRPIGGRTVVGTWFLAKRHRVVVEKIRRGHQRRVVVATRPAVVAGVAAWWIRAIRRVRSIIRRRVFRTEPPERGLPVEFDVRYGYPKGANAQAGSLLGDNAGAGSQKGWSG